MSATLTPSNAVSRRVRCVLETGTNTEGFLSDRAPVDKDDSVSMTTSEDTATFFKSSSSVRETPMNVRRPSSTFSSSKQILDNSGDHSYRGETLQKFNALSPSRSRSKRSEISDNVASNKIMYSNKNTTNPTLTDTFDFLFAPITDNNLNNDNMKFATLSKNINSKRVNFDLLRTEVQKNYDFQASNVFKSLVNRNLTSLMFNNEELSSGDQEFESKPSIKETIEKRNRRFSEWKSYGDLEENLLSKSTKQISDISELPYSKQESYLPLNPEGDTCDSHSDMIKIYPQFAETKHTRLQLFNYLHHEESPISQYSTSSDNTKIKSPKLIEKVKCQKIFSKYHKSLAMHKMGGDNHKIIKNQSIEIMKLFHQTLTYNDELF